MAKFAQQQLRISFKLQYYKAEKTKRANLTIFDKFDLLTRGSLSFICKKTRDDCN